MACLKKYYCSVVRVFSKWPGGNNKTRKSLIVEYGVDDFSVFSSEQARTSKSMKNDEP